MCVCAETCTYVYHFDGLDYDSDPLFQCYVGVGGGYKHKYIIYVCSPAEDYKNVPNNKKDKKKITSKVVTFTNTSPLYVVIFKMTWLTALKFELQKRTVIRSK